MQRAVTKIAPPTTHSRHQPPTLQAHDGKPADSGRRRATYRKSQLRDSYACESWRKGRDPFNKWVHALNVLDDARGRESEESKAARHARARRALEENARQRASTLGLRVFKVVHDGRGVAVRAGPSRDNKIVSVRKLGDEVLVTEERDGWVRMSEEDDDYPYVGEAASGQGGRECWMLVDGAEVGLGLLLEEQLLAYACF